MYTMEEIYLDNLPQKEDIKKFLNQFNLDYECDIDYSIAVYDNENLIATASKAKNVLKCFAILEEYQGRGITNSLVKKIEDRMFEEGLYHFFIFTPYHNKEIFTSIGYTEVITSQDISILENGNQQVDSYLQQLKTKHHLADEPKACIIMNANPFTLGHRYLIETAAKENEHLLVFVVTEDQSSFPFSVRYQLVKEGIKDLNNVTVLETGPYLISSVTFPTYFLKKSADIVSLQTKIDCDLFIKYYKKYFHIIRRYVGTEPYCEVTDTYNQIMKRVLPQQGIEVKEMTRKYVGDEIISASKVRVALKADHLSVVKKYVPKSTYEYLISKQAAPIIKQIKAQDSRH